MKKLFIFYVLLQNYFLFQAEQPISTETGLLTATIPVSICTIGLKTALQPIFKNSQSIFTNNNELLSTTISTAACTTIYTAFLATASLKK